MDYNGCYFLFVCTLFSEIKIHPLINYLFSNGDAHIENFSLLETPMADFRLSPAYDLLNSRIHIEDKDFALNDGLLPRNLAKGKVYQQFFILAAQVGIMEKQARNIHQSLLSGSEKVAGLVKASFLDERTKRNYWQTCQTRLKKLAKL